MTTHPAMVYLVGAGPGDYGLVTLKAIECLKRADVVVYDHLADPRILQWAPESAERIYVGKISAHHTMKQEGISELLAAKAISGKTVVRLKGGDPFVFGRGGEEGIVLRKAGVPFEIVPGVTSAISVPAYAGIPVTHRAIARSFAVVTGHKDPTTDGDVNWEALATATDTIVFLMGIANLKAITENLVKYGRDPETPAAVIRWGTKPEQRVLTTTVGTAAEDVVKNGLKPPAIFIVGDVVKLREELQWFDNLAQRPLFGKKVLVTRARAQASKLTMALEQLGADVREVPAIALADPSDGYAAIDAAIAKLCDYQWIIFTSTNGVERFFQRLENAGKDTRALGYAQVAAIGSATAEKLATYGIRADVVPTVYRAEGILDALKGKLPPHANILIPRAEQAREILPKTLREQGYTIDVAPVYQTVTAEADGAALRQELEQGGYDIVTFTSSSTVTNLVKILGDAEPLKSTKVACIGPVTAETAKKNGIEANIVAETYTIDGLVAAIREAL